MTRVAAIDCGTNSVRLLVADLPPATGLPSGADPPDGRTPGADSSVTGPSAGRTPGAGRSGDRPPGVSSTAVGVTSPAAAGGRTDLTRRLELVRLGEGVDRTGRLSAAAIARTRAALAGYAAEIARLGAERVRMVATSASRDAANGDEFTAMVVDTLGVTPEVVTGEEEARLSYAGAVRGLPAGARPPYLVVDIGGGSTEFVLGSDPDRHDAAVSVDIGCVRMTERHLHGDPPTPGQIAAAEADVTAAVDRALAAIGEPGPVTLLGLAGSVTTVAAIALDLPEYRSEWIHHRRIGYPQVAKVSAELLAMPRQRRLALPVMHSGRADVIGAGALILRLVMARLSASEVLVSEHDILDGIAWSLV